MSTPTLILGNNKWAIEEDSILGYAVEDRNGSYLPREISFTRGSDATYTDSTGVIRQACWNLLQYSEQFDNPYWSKIASTITTNTTTAPDGNATADTITENTATGRHFAYAQITTVSGTVYSASVYVKNLSRRYITISLKNVTGASPVYSATFDLIAGINTTTFSGGAPLNTSNFITSVGNGWYRIGISMQATSASTYFEIGLSNSATPSYSEGMATYTGDGTSALYYWGAQLVQGSDALGYLRTTDRLNMPRVDSSTGTKAFLLEPQRTNLLTYSQAFNDATWAKVASTGGSITATDNYNASPDGNTNASRLLITNLNSAYVAKSFTSVNGSSYTISIWAKSNTASSYTFQLRDGYSGVVSSNLTVTPTWQRFTLTFTASGTTAELQFRTLVVGSYDLSIYGAQAELGAYQTTYIPTQATTVTRIADSAVKTGISGLIGQSDGTVFIDVYFNQASNAQFRAFFSLEGSVSSQFSGFVVSTTNNGNDVSYAGTNYSLTTGRHKIACTYSQANNQRKLFVDGVLRGTSTHTNFLSTIDRVSVGCRINPFSGFATDRELGSGILNFATYSELLSDSELVTLTTL